jgi:hypothetical protein
VDRRLLRSVVWRRKDAPSLEYCRLWQLTAAGFALEGQIVAVLDSSASGAPGESAPERSRPEAALPCMRAPVSCHYTVVCSEEWRTRSVHVRLDHDGQTRFLEIDVDDRGRWWRDRRELPEFREVLDIDLAITPCTNTLPIRRLSLDIGQHADVTAAWIRFPELSIEPLTQRYTHARPGVYDYESDGGSFKAELAVDDLGLIVAYGSIWERV